MSATRAAYVAGRGAPVAARVETADTTGSRGKGLLGRDSLAADEGLLIVLPAVHAFVPLPTIHTFFMRFAIDVVFLDRDMRALRVIEDMKPWRVSPWVARAASVLELAGGALKGAVKPGDVLELRPA